MDTDVTVALITGVVALLVALIGTGINAFVAWRGAGRQAAYNRELEEFKDQLARSQQERAQDRMAREVFNSYRRPLLHAALELERRLGNIQHANFGTYLEQDGRRGELARRTTLYRLSSYLGWREIIVRELTFLEAEEDAVTKDLIAHMNDVNTQLANDWVTSADSMIWKDEQRAIGGLMIQEGTPTRIIGFEVFDARYEEVFAPWLGAFAGVLHTAQLSEHPRLTALAKSLADAITVLDREMLYIDRHQS